MIEPVITQPEDLAPEQISTIPNPATERTATALLSLLAYVAETHDIQPGLLVSLRGDISEHGSVGMFAQLPFEGAMEYESLIVASYDAREPCHFIDVRVPSEDRAADEYRIVLERLA